MIEFLAKYWPLIFFTGGAIATSAVAIYQVRQHEAKVKAHDEKIDDIEISMVEFKRHLKERRQNPVITAASCQGERDACPLKATLDKDREIKALENSALNLALNRMEVLAKERHTEILNEFSLHRQTHNEIDRRHNNLSEKVAVLYEKLNSDRKHNERAGDKRE